jgi:secreted protein
MLKVFKTANIFQRRRRLALLGGLAVLLVILVQIPAVHYRQFWAELGQFFGYDVGLGQFQTDQASLDLLNTLEVKGRAPKTGYKREQFSDGWGKVGACDMRNVILKRDLTEVQVDQKCKVLTGKLHDPYTGQFINYQRGQQSSSAVQIDHIVAVSDAWQKGAQQLTPAERHQFYNDPDNLLAVDGPANQQKGDADAATWLPSNKSFRCQYVARQVKIKARYKLWVTESEKQAIARELTKCPK